MALVVEDGTVVVNAESYIDVTGADTYITNFYGADDEFLSFTTTEKEMYLRRAAYFMDNYYQHRYRGARYDSNHTMAWPRTGVYNDFDHELLANSEFPGTELGRAQVEIARKIAEGVDFEPDAIRLALREKVGPIEVEYASATPVRPTLRNVETILSRWLATSTNVSMVKRA